MLKKILLLFAGIFLFTTFISVVLGQSIIRNEEDEFTGNRIIQADHERIEHEGFSGRTLISAAYNEGDYYMMITVMSRDSWQLLSANSADFIIDDERQSYDLHRIDTETSGGSTTELYAIILSASEFEKFGGANDIRFRANRNIYTLNQEVKDSFLLVLNELEE